MTSLAERVLEAIEAAEADAQDLHRDGCVSLHEQYPLDRLPCACGVPAAVLRRCAADRKILDLHQAIVTGLPTLPLICETCGSGECDTYPTAWPCPTLAALAEAYGVPLEQEET